MALVNSVNPMRLEGQKTAAFEIVDFLGDAPDVHVLPVGNAGNISAYWKGYREYADAGRATRLPRDARLAGRGRRAAGDRRAGPRPRDRSPRRSGSATRPRGSSPMAAARRVRRPVPARSPTSRSWPRSASSPRRDGVFVEPASAAGVAGLLAERGRGDVGTPASTVVVTVTGHGLKDIDTALSTFTDLVDTVVRRRRRAAAAEAAGLR